MLFGWGPKKVLRVDSANVPDDPFAPVDAASRLLDERAAAIAVGYVSYDMGGYCEPSAASRHAPDSMPLLYLALYDEYFTYDPASGRLARHTAASRRGDAGPLRREILRRASSRAAPAAKPPAPRATSNFTHGEYMDAVRAAREYILSGDIYEVNLSQRLFAPYSGDLAELYLRLRRYNPAPYAAFLRVDDAAILSSSPELFLRVEHGRVTTRPIKGTARRWERPQDDDAAARSLTSSVKDNAELAMIIDLERNDLGRVCRYGSVLVAEKSRVETFARVHHLVSTVQGRLRPGTSLAAVLNATFPGGSITGAPKIRAMQIIDELEPCRRGVYTGSIGYILPGGRAELNIAIRTIVHRMGILALQVGGAVTSDSDPEAEYQETIAKAEAMLAAVGSSAPGPEGPPAKERRCDT